MDKSAILMSQLPFGTKALIFAAGLGTRLKPFTDNHPKALAMVNGKSLLQRNIEYLKRFGIQEFIINVHHFSEQIIAFIEKHEKFGAEIHFSNEKTEALETGGGLVYAKPFLTGSLPFIVMNVDILTSLDLSKMYQAHLNHKALATLAITNRHSSRGFLYNKDGRLIGWKNRTTEETKISIDTNEPLMGSFSGIHIIDPIIFTLTQRTGKFSIVDLYLELAALHSICVYDHTGDTVIDVGKPESIEKAEQFFT